MVRTRLTVDSWAEVGYIAIKQPPIRTRSGGVPSGRSWASNAPRKTAPASVAPAGGSIGWHVMPSR